MCLYTSEIMNSLFSAAILIPMRSTVGANVGRF